jgi:hypothetical protein
MGLMFVHSKRVPKSLTHFALSADPGADRQDKVQDGDAHGPQRRDEHASSARRRRGVETWTACLDSSLQGVQNARSSPVHGR